MAFKEIKLGDVATSTNGYAFKSRDYSDTGIPVVKIKNIVPPTVSLDDCDYVSKEIYNETKQFVLHRGDILISMKVQLCKLSIIKILIE